MTQLRKKQRKRTSDLHHRSIVIDALALKCSLYESKYFNQMREGGVTAANITVAGNGGKDNFISALRKVEAAIRKIEESPEMLLATKSEDIRSAKKEGKIAIILGFQDGKPIEDDLSHLRVFHRLGVRIIQLTYNTQNLIGTGCCELTRGGLTYFGREAVEEMNRLGIAVDLSHCVDATTLEAIETSKTPPVFTHANVRSLCNTPRNKTDDQIKDLAEKGGVMGISVFPVMLKMDQAKEGRPTIRDVLKHIDYVVELVGVDHVGLGFDINAKGVDEGWVSNAMGYWRMRRPDVYGFDKPIERYPPFVEGIERHNQFPNLTEALISRGYSELEVEKILGTNFLKLFEQVWGR